MGAFLGAAAANLIREPWVVVRPKGPPAARCRGELGLSAVRPRKGTAGVGLVCVCVGVGLKGVSDMREEGCLYRLEFPRGPHHRTLYLSI